MAALYYDKRIATVGAATTEAAGYSASNVNNESLSREWRATGAGANDVTITFPANVSVHSLFVHGVNFASCPAQWSSDGINFNTIGTLTTYADRHGRRRGRITINQASVKALRIQIGAGTPTDGLGVWRVGAMYPFGSTVTPTAFPKYTFRVRTRRPRVNRELVNGMVAAAETGLRSDRLDLSFLRKDTESVDDFIQRATAGTVLLDMGVSPYPEQQWPVRCVEQDLDETFTRPRESSITVPLVEVV